MRAEKQFISAEYLARLKRSPFFIVVDYQGLKVGPITELRKRLKVEGFLSRDARAKERKKYGQKGARKRFQFSKR